MPTPERPPGGDSKEREQPPYLKTARFAQEATARTVYFAVQETIGSQPCDLSTYRFFLDQISHVAVLGQPPPADLAQRIDALLARGTPVTLPPDIVAVLTERRAQAQKLGSWVEGHYRPGRRFPPPRRDT